MKNLFGVDLVSCSIYVFAWLLMACSFSSALFTSSGFGFLGLLILLGCRLVHEIFVTLLNFIIRASRSSEPCTVRTPQQRSPDSLLRALEIHISRFGKKRFSTFGKVEYTRFVCTPLRSTRFVFTPLRSTRFVCTPLRFTRKKM